MADATRSLPSALRAAMTGRPLHAAVWGLVLWGWVAASSIAAEFSDSGRLKWIRPERAFFDSPQNTSGANDNEESDRAEWVRWSPLLGEAPGEADGPLLDAGLSPDEDVELLSDERPQPAEARPQPAEARPQVGPPITPWGDPAAYPGLGGDYTNEQSWPAPLGLFGHAGRHRGIGQPLLCESWRYRPFGAGWFMGMMQGSTLIDDWTGTDAGYFAGYWLTWDYDHYWGFEFRYGFGSLPQWDSLRAKIAQQQADTLNGLAPDDPLRQRYDRRRDMDVNVWDFRFVHYPWGDAAWRPYALVGLGGSRIGFDDRLARHWTNRVVAMPLGLGVKYRWNSRWALRVEVLDNMIFGDNGVKTQHNFSATAGVEVRFGGTRKAYWPYNPGRHYW